MKSLAKNFALVQMIALLFQMAPILAAEDDEVVAGPVTQNAQQEERNFGFPNFDQMVFQASGDAKRCEERMRARTELQLAELERVCGLSDVQKRKLNLAARGDLQRFLSEVGVARHKYDAKMKGAKLNDHLAFNQVWMEMQQDIQPLQIRASGGLTALPQSLFMKVLPQSLTAEQHQSYQVVVEERIRFRYAANVSTALFQLEDITTLTENQQDALAKLLEAMPPPKSTQYMTHVILIRLGNVPPQKIQPLFTADQWKSLNPHLDQYRNLRLRWIEAGVINAEDIPLEDVQEKQ
jgi:hypothetical protein